MQMFLTQKRKHVLAKRALDFTCKQVLWVVVEQWILSGSVGVGADVLGRQAGRSRLRGHRRQELLRLYQHISNTACLNAVHFWPVVSSITSPKAVFLHIFWPLHLLRSWTVRFPWRSDAPQTGHISQKEEKKLRAACVIHPAKLPAQKETANCSTNSYGSSSQLTDAGDQKWIRQDWQM